MTVVVNKFEKLYVHVTLLSFMLFISVTKLINLIQQFDPTLIYVPLLSFMLFTVVNELNLIQNLNPTLTA